MITLISYIVLKYMFGVDYNAAIYLVTISFDMWFMHIIDNIVDKMKSS